MDFLAPDKIFWHGQKNFVHDNLGFVQDNLGFVLDKNYFVRAEGRGIRLSQNELSFMNMTIGDKLI